MRKLLATFLLVISLKADTAVINQEKLTELGKTFYIITVCKDGYIHTAIQNQEKQMVNMYQNFELSSITNQNQPIRCEIEFKHPVKFVK